jgi:hypothetical protein
MRKRLMQSWRMQPLNIRVSVAAWWCKKAGLNVFSLSEYRH